MFANYIEQEVSKPGEHDAGKPGEEQVAGKSAGEATTENKEAAPST